MIGGLVALGGAAVTGNLGGGGDTTTVVRPAADLAPAEGPQQLTPPLAPETRDSDRARSVQRIVREASVSVVTVTSGGGPRRQLGSGFVVDRHGRILTNEHVLTEEDSAEITLEDGTVREATVLGRDPSIDLAVLEVEDLPESARPVPLGRSLSLTVGDAVVAIGSPFGLERTATTGIVSALKRTIEAPDGFLIQNTIQTDAAINQGNSGGPLLDAAGRVIGINSQIASPDGGGNDGVGFAVPIDSIRPVAESIIETGKAEHAWIGITGRSLTPDDAKKLGMEDRHGVAVLSVDARGPAKEGGLRGSGEDRDPPRGADLIVRVDGVDVSDMADVSQAIGSRRVGVSVTLGVLRDGETIEVELTLADRPADIGAAG